MKKRLSNIFKIKNFRKETKDILKSSYRMLQVYLPHFPHNFWRKIFLWLYSTIYYLTKFHRLVAFTSGDTGQYVYCNCLLTRWWHHKFWNKPSLSNKTVFSTWPKCHDKKFKYLENEKNFQDEIKSIFHQFSRAFC